MMSALDIPLVNTNNKHMHKAISMLASALLDTELNLIPLSNVIVVDDECSSPSDTNNKNYELDMNDNTFTRINPNILTECPPINHNRFDNAASDGSERLMRTPPPSTRTMDSPRLCPLYGESALTLVLETEAQILKEDLPITLD